MTTGKIRSLIMCVGAAALLTACTDGPPQSGVPDITLAQVQPINLNVSRIEVVDKYVPPMKSPNYDHMFRQPPLTVTHSLINKQLVAGGPEKVLRVIVDDASVIRTDLSAPDGFFSSLTPHPSERYHARVAIRFEMVNADAPDVVLAHAEVSSDREKTIYDDASPADRDAAFLDLDEGLVSDLSSGFSTVVKRTFGTVN
ncbi:MAG: hypothetical protein PW788_08710 [Micavibrio sp.]|nr:hypothetical protein [Micavibrio sp.]